MTTSRREFLKTAVALPAALQLGAAQVGAQEATGQKKFRRIALEEAFITPELYAAWRKRGEKGWDDEPGFQGLAPIHFDDSPGAKLIQQRLIDVGELRIEEMDATGVDVHVVSLTAPGVQILDKQPAVDQAKIANDTLSAAVAVNPDRFAGLAAVAPQAPAEAARELERGVKQLGLRGAIINSHTYGEYLDDEKFWPIFETAESLDVPIYLHPRTPSPAMLQPFLKYGLEFATWGFKAETGLHALRLIYGGVFDKYPSLTIILGHMGEGIPFWLQRIDNRYQLQVRLGQIKALNMNPSEYFKRNFMITTSGVNFHPALKLSHEVLGADRIMWAIDYPYESSKDSVEFMDSAPFPAEDVQKIYAGNAERLLKL